MTLLGRLLGSCLSFNTRSTVQQGIQLVFGNTIERLVSQNWLNIFLQNVTYVFFVNNYKFIYFNLGFHSNVLLRPHTNNCFCTFSLSSPTWMVQYQPNLVHKTPMYCTKCKWIHFLDTVILIEGWYSNVLVISSICKKVIFTKTIGKSNLA